MWKQGVEQELRQIAANERRLTFGKAPEEHGVFKVGIVGSGVSGLFTAMLIDKLNERFKGLNISHDLLEATGPSLLGGRLYTHRFTENPLEHQ